VTDPPIIAIAAFVVPGYLAVGLCVTIALARKYGVDVTWPRWLNIIVGWPFFVLLIYEVLAILSEVPTDEAS